MFDFIRNLRKSDEEKWQDQINDYLEDALSPPARQRFEQKLEGDAELRREIAHRQAILEAMQKMPARRAPRNFTLTPDMVGVKAPAPVWYRQPTFRVAGALAAIMVVAMFAFAALQSGGGNIANEPSSVAQIEERAVEVTRVVAETITMEGDAVEVTRAVTEAIVEEGEAVEVTRVVTEEVEEEAMDDVSTFNATAADNDDASDAEMMEAADVAIPAEPEGDGATMAGESASEVSEPQMSDEPPILPSPEGTVDGNGANNTSAGITVEATALAKTSTPLPAPTQTQRPAPRQVIETPPLPRADGTTTAEQVVVSPESGADEPEVLATDTTSQFLEGGGGDGGRESERGNAGIPITIGVVLLLAIGLWFWRNRG